MLKKIKTIFCKFFGILWVSLTCSLLASPHDIGGAEFNGILSFLLWILLCYIIVKNHTLLAGILGTAILAGISISKFGWGNLPAVAEESGTALGMVLMAFILYKLFSSKQMNDMGSRTHTHRDSTPVRSTPQTPPPEVKPDYSDYPDDPAPRLVNGSDEYWTYLNSAEQIYHAFCDSRTSDERRYYKKQGERLKTRLLIEYGHNDESVKSICERFLDLRV